MSYDVEAGGDSFNYTSNMYQFFKDFEVYPRDWDGMDRHEVSDKIDAALTMIESNDLETLQAEYDAPNGWGSVLTAIDWLKLVRAACRREIPREVSV